ncbi:MAG: FecR domain-containing protein [Thermoanaerobaculales bacterium]|nr:FecR domain-containing protein [Thermoanaerobaculales bacterium]
MNRTTLVALLVASVAAVAAVEPDAVPITYEVLSIDGKLFLENEPEPSRLNPGDRPVSGDRLRTGSSTVATIGVPTHTAVFRIDSKTSCTLAHHRPGLILHVERGRVRALFGSFTGAEPRLVTTPSAVLAVRGTEYGVKVKRKGATQIVVFEGIVEVSDPAGVWTPVIVEAGEQTRVKPDQSPQAPSPHRLTPLDWDRGFDQPPGRGRDGSMSPGGRGMSPGSQSGSGPGSSGSGSKRRGG